MKDGLTFVSHLLQPQPSFEVEIHDATPKIQAVGLMYLLLVVVRA